jgi:hypothetical protein
VNVIDTRESQLALDTFGDFIRAAGVIGITGFVVSVILCYLYLFFLRYSPRSSPAHVLISPLLCRSIPCMLTIIVWTNIIVIEIGFILGAALLLSKAGHEDDSDDPSRMSSTEVGSHFILLSFLFHLLCLVILLFLNLRSKCFEGWVPYLLRLVSSGFVSFVIFVKGLFH